MKTASGAKRRVASSTLSVPLALTVKSVSGSRFSNCSMLEAIAACERIAGKRLQWTYTETNRIGDHIWYISDTRKFQRHYPDWKQEYDLERLLQDIYEKNVERWAAEAMAQSRA